MIHELKFTIQHSNILVLEGDELKQLVQAYQKGNFKECYIENWLIDCDSFSLGNLYYIEYRNKMGNMVRYSQSGDTIFEFTVPFNHADKFTCIFYHACPTLSRVPKAAFFHAFAEKKIFGDIKI